MRYNRYKNVSRKQETSALSTIDHHDSFMLANHGLYLEDISLCQ